MKYTVRVEFHKDFLKIDGSEMTIGVKSKPVKGQANKEILKKLSMHFHIPVSNIAIKSGLKSKIKIVEIPS